MKYVLAIDSFKGSLTSAEAEDAAAEAIREYHPDAEIVSIPVSDGGDGMLDAFLSAVGGERVAVQVHNPLMHLIEAHYGISSDGGTAIIEMAQASGLSLIACRDRNPMLATTVGTGEMIADAMSRGCRRFIVGLGGSATCDGGTGMLQALGYHFLSSEGEMMETGARILQDIVDIDDSDVNPLLKDCLFLIASDVISPLYGEHGAAYVFGPQKGADPSMVEQLDRGLRHFSDVVKAKYGHDVTFIEGAGAAGGVGAALMMFTEARMFSGGDMLLDLLSYEKRIADADVVITGEGRADAQTLSGKMPYRLLQRSRPVPVVLIAGRVEDRDALLRCGFRNVAQTTPEGMPLSVAMIPSVARRNIRRAVISMQLDYRSGI